MTENHFPYFVRTAAPGTEPIALSDAKAFLRVSGSNDDTLITRLIVTAREAAESFLQRSLITQSWKLSYDDYAPSCIMLPRGPVQSITSVTMIALDGSQTTVASGNYRLNAGKEILIMDSPLVSYIVEVVYVTGYGSSAATVPSPIVQGMYAHIAEMYEKRVDGMPISTATKNLYQPYRIMSF